MTAEEFAQMSICNLAKSIHNKWRQASGNTGGDLYVATVDDYIQTFLQVVAYPQFFKSGVGSDGPSKKNLSFDALNVVLNVLVTLLFCRRFFSTCMAGSNYVLVVPPLEGAEVLGSHKRKLDTPIGADDETHRPDTLNFSRPHVAQRTTKSHASPLPTIVEGSSQIVFEVPPPLFIGLDFRVSLLYKNPK
jgi:hypothetical protein